MKADMKQLNQLYEADTPQQIGDIYNQWSVTYDDDLNQGSDYVAPTVCLNILRNYAPSTDGLILDAGAGTGLFGELLRDNGYINTVGIDVSEGMLKKARDKSIYREVHQKILGEPLGFDANTFDAVVSVGVFSPGQGPSSAFEELIQITRPGGYIIYTLRPEFYEQPGSEFQRDQLALEMAGKWTLVEKTAKFQGLPKSEPDFFYNVWVYRVN